MKRLMQLVMAAILICGATLFASCTNEDNPTDPAANLSEMIIGKWITADIGGQAAPTNVKMVTTFISTTKAIASSSKVDFTEKDRYYTDKRVQRQFYFRYRTDWQMEAHYNCRWCGDSKHRI